jgi:hypothetical protein
VTSRTASNAPPRNTEGAWQNFSLSISYHAFLMMSSLNCFVHLGRSLAARWCGAPSGDLLHLSGPSPLFMRCFSGVQAIATSVEIGFQDRHVRPLRHPSDPQLGHRQREEMTPQTLPSLLLPSDCLHSTHIRTQGFWNHHGSIGLLVIFQNRHECSTNGESRAV